MNNSSQYNNPVLDGICLKCFHLIYSVDQKRFECDKYRMILSGKVQRCPGFLPISEGVDQLIAKMKAQGEIPEWVGE